MRPPEYDLSLFCCSLVEPSSFVVFCDSVVVAVGGVVVVVVVVLSSKMIRSAFLGECVSFLDFQKVTLKPVFELNVFTYFDQMISC